MTNIGVVRRGGKDDPFCSLFNGASAFSRAPRIWPDSTMYSMLASPQLRQMEPHCWGNWASKYQNFLFPASVALLSYDWNHPETHWSQIHGHCESLIRKGPFFPLRKAISTLFSQICLDICHVSKACGWHKARITVNESLAAVVALGRQWMYQRILIPGSFAISMEETLGKHWEKETRVQEKALS